MLIRLPLSVAFVLISLASLQAQVVNPADKQKKPAPQDTPQSDWPQHSWELPAITVPGEPLPEFRDEERVGAYGQPRWTTKRPFANTRVYVLPEGQMEF